MTPREMIAGVLARVQDKCLRGADDAREAALQFAIGCFRIARDARSRERISTIQAAIAVINLEKLDTLVALVVASVNEVVRDPAAVPELADLYAGVWG